MKVEHAQSAHQEQFLKIDRTILGEKVSEMTPGINSSSSNIIPDVKDLQGRRKLIIN